MKYKIEFRIPVQVTPEDITGMLSDLGVALQPGAPISQSLTSVTVETVNTYTPEQLAATSSEIWQKIVATAVKITEEK